MGQPICNLPLSLNCLGIEYVGMTLVLEQREDISIDPYAYDLFIVASRRRNLAAFEEARVSLREEGIGVPWIIGEEPRHLRETLNFAYHHVKTNADARMCSLIDTPAIQCVISPIEHIVRMRKFVTGEIDSLVLIDQEFGWSKTQDNKDANPDAPFKFAERCASEGIPWMFYTDETLRSQLRRLFSQ